jgi:putative oxidoreductase
MKNLLQCTCADAWGDLAPLVLRVVVGAVFAVHGADKLFTMGLEGTSGFLDGLGFPIPVVFAVLLIAAELLGGIALILGLFTHWAAKINFIVAIVAFFTVHMANGFSIRDGGYEYIIVLAAALFSLMVTGAGKYSLDAKMRANKLVESGM